MPLLRASTTTFVSFAADNDFDALASSELDVARYDYLPLWRFIRSRRIAICLDELKRTIGNGIEMNR